MVAGVPTCRCGRPRVSGYSCGCKAHALTMQGIRYDAPPSLPLPPLQAAMFGVESRRRWMIPRSTGRMLYSEADCPPYVGSSRLGIRAPLPLLLSLLPVRFAVTAPAPSVSRSEPRLALCSWFTMERSPPHPPTYLLRIVCTGYLCRTITLVYASISRRNATPDPALVHTYNR